MSGGELACAQVAALLNDTLGLQVDNRRNAEKQLLAFEARPGYADVLMTVIREQTVALQLRVAAAIRLKNIVKRQWKVSEDDGSSLNKSDRDLIKDNVVSLMFVSEPPLQKQLAEVVSLVGAYDFPNDWQSLLPQLTDKFGANWQASDAALRTAYSLFKHYRYEARSDKLWLEIKYVLEAFAPPLTQLFSTAVAASAADRSQAAGTVPSADGLPLWNTLVLCVKVFYCLNAQDLPEYFEDNMAVWMNGFLQLLKGYPYAGSSVSIAAAGNTDDESSVAEDLASAISDCIAMYAQKYEEEFGPYLPNFVEVVWSLLMQTDSRGKFDSLVANAIQFLGSVAERPQYKSLFESDEALRGVCEQTVLPNMFLRDTDTELFDDNPEEFIRNDLEGSDADTRRRAAADFVRSLCKQFEPKVVQIFGSLIQNNLSKYAENPSEYWKLKDGCIYIVMALANQGGTARFGATKTSGLVSAVDFYAAHIKPELVDSDVNRLPILKAAALKYAVVFRASLFCDGSADAAGRLTECFQAAIKLLTAESVVVRTYAAHFVERVMILRNTSHQPLVPPAMLEPLATPLLTNLFGALYMSGTELCEYVMRAIMRTVGCLKAAVVPFTETIVTRLSQKLAEIAKNPSKPQFNHYLFETYCVLIRGVHAAVGGVSVGDSVIGQFESALFPPFQEILQQDVVEFLPYVFQILAMMLNMRAPGSGAPDSYAALFPFLLLPALWERSGTAPSLSALLASYVRVGAARVVADAQLNPLLGVFQLLAASKANDQYAFVIAAALLQHMDWPSLEPNAKPMLVMLFNRYQTCKTNKFSRGLVVFLCRLVVRRGAATLRALLDSIQPGMFLMVLEKIICEEGPKVTDARQKKIVAVGLTNIATELLEPIATAKPSVWSACVASAVSLLEGSLDDAASSAEEMEEAAAAELAASQGYSAAHATLAYADVAGDTDPTGVSDARAHLAKQLEMAAAAKGAQLMPLLQAAPHNVQQALGAYAKQYGARLA